MHRESLAVARLKLYMHKLLPDDMRTFAARATLANFVLFNYQLSKHNIVLL